MSDENQNKQRSNGEVFVRALMSHRPIEYRGSTYQLIKAGDPIVCIGGVYEADHDLLTLHYGEYVLPWDGSFNDFMRMCADMTEEERIGIIGSQVLMSMHQRR